MSMMMPPGPPGGGGGPDDLMTMLANAAGQAPGGPPGGSAGPPDATAGPGMDPNSPGGERAAVALLRQAIDAISQYLNVEPDDIDRASAAKVLAGLQAILAKDQKDMEQAVGVTPTSRYLARQAIG